MVHAGLAERVRDPRHPGPPLPPSWYGAEDRWPAWGGVVRHRTLLRRVAVIAALALAATSVAPVHAQTRYYVLFPAGEQPASPKNEISFPNGSSSSTYQVKGAQSGDDITPIADSLLEAVFLDGNTKIRVTPQSVTPAAFAAVYGATGGVGGDVEVDAGVFEGANTSADLLFIVAVRYDASARFTNAQPINSQRWGTPQIEIYEGATADPALAFAWAAHGGGTRNWGTGNPTSAYRCVVGGDAVTFSAWPSSAGEDSTLFQVTPTSTSAASGNGRLNLTAAPDYENPTDSGGDNLYRVRVRNGHNLNNIFGEGTRTGCDGSALELTVRVKDAGPPAPVGSLTGILDSNTMTIAVDWTAPAGFLDGSDSSVVVPFNTARKSGGGIPGTAVVGYDYEYRLEGSSTWTQGTTTSTSFEITGVGASDAYRVRVRARNAEGAGAFTTIDAPRQLEELNNPPSVSASCQPCTVVPGGEVQLTATASDPDGDNLTYAWTASQGAFSGETDAAATSWTAPDAPGRVTIRVEVSDNRGGSEAATVAVTVESPNRSPSVSVSCDPCEAPRLGEVELTATASDPDGNALTYAWSAPAGSFNGAADAATARWTAPDSLGPVTIRVEVTDGYGGSASAEVTIEVENALPSVSVSCDPCEAPRLGEVELTATASDPDGNALTYAWSAPAGAFSGAADAATARWTAPDSLGPVTIRVEVTDEDGGSASAEVTVGVENRPPAFEPSEYALELRENMDGSRQPVGLGTVVASDPDGDELTYELASGDLERFAVGSGDGAVRYVGPGEDFELEPNRYELTLFAQDPHGGAAEALVVVTVVNVNEPPESEDDEAATDEDQAVTVDVLANDTDPDGDRLWVESVSAAAHGTATVTGGGVLYTPEPNYHGMDRFTYAVSDGNGGTAEATVEVTVAPVNDAPEPVGVIPDQMLDEGGGEATVELGPFFEDIEGDALTFRASSSDPQVAAVTVSGAVLTLTPVVYGSAAVTVTAEDPGGLSAALSFAVGVSDRLVREVVGNTLAGMARSHLSSARMTLGRRASSGRQEPSRVTVLGRQMPLGGESARQMAEQMLWGWLPAAPGGAGGAAGLGAGPFGGFGAAGVGPSASGAMSEAAGGLGSLAGGLPSVVGFGGGADPLRASAFLLSLGGGEEGDETEPGRRWQVWGQGDVQSFQGAPSEATGYDGGLRTGYVGVDTPMTERWLAGVAAAHSRGSGNWRAGGSQGALATRLTTVQPYARWSDGTTAVWAMTGGGWGAAENVRGNGRVGTSGLGLWLGLVEFERRLVESDRKRPEFGVRADAGWAVLRTGAGDESIDNETAAVSQVRFGAEASWPLRLGEVPLAAFGEAHARHDGGGGQTGAGLEVAGGLRLAAGRVRLVAQGRMLAVHSAAGYRERGVGLTLTVGNRSEEGLSLSVSPQWGDAAAGGGALWQDQVYRQYLRDAARGEWGMDARGSYGMRMPDGGLLTWFGSVSHSLFGRRFEFGGRVGVLD